MKNNSLGEYLEEMRQRHPRLSKRRMSIDAGLSPSVVEHIISGKTGSKPRTLKLLTNTWGTDDDYRELMQLAGHPMPDSETASNPDNETLQKLIREYNQMTAPTQKLMLAIAHTFNETGGMEKGNNEELPTTSQNSSASA